MPILRAVIHQQEYPRRSHTLTQETETRLGFGIQPVQVLKDEDKWLVDALPHQQPLERLKRAPLPYVRVHLLEGRGRLGDPQ